MVRAAHVCAALLLLACLPQSAAAKWTALQSTNFLFVGDAPERQIHRVAQRLEQFRDVVGQIVPATLTRSVPTVVVVFANDRSFRPYTPRFQGRAVEVAGYFAGSEDAAYLALNAELEEIAFTTIFHEYAHFITASSGARLPPWASEGLAQVWETFQERDGGRAAVIGIAAAHQVGLLRSSTLIPLRDLRAVTHDSPLYNEGSRRSVFYAQSWALMHYLMLGNPVRTTQLRTFLNAVRTGTEPDQAFASAFGADDRPLEQELFEYVRKFTFPAVRYEFDQKIGGAVDTRGDPIADAEASGYLGGLLAALRRTEDARTLLTATLKTAPQAVRPAIALAQLDLEEGKLDETVARLTRVVDGRPGDGAALEALGRALFEQHEGQRTDAALRTRAHGVLTRAAAAERAAAHTLAMLASLELEDDGNLDRAIALLERAAKQAPGREQYRLMAAEALIRQRQFERATSYLGPLMAAGSTSAVRDSARRLLGAAANMRTLAPPQPGPAAAARGGDGAATMPLGTSSRPAPLPKPSASTPRYILDLRRVGPGETRVAGVFRGIECEATAVIILIDVNGRVLRIAAERLDRIDFISYRSETPGSVACGALAPTRVLATYRADAKVTANSDGVAVAIELLPDGYTLP